MRLPTVTAQQLEHENSRQRHEEWYRAFLAGETLSYAIDPSNYIREQTNYSARSRRFWAQRGFKIHTRVSADKCSLTIWLESMGQKEQAA